MRTPTVTFLLVLVAGAFALALSAPSPAPARTLGPVEILVEDVAGPTTPGQVAVLDLLVVPQDRSLTITDVQAQAFGTPAWLLRDGRRVAQLTHVVFSATAPPPEALHTSILAGIEFAPGSRVQLELPADYDGTFLSLRGHYAQDTPRLTTITAP